MDANDRYACAELIQAWGLYRDQGKWPQLLATFVPEGRIAVAWFSGSFREFVDRCRQSFDAGQRSKHQIFPSIVRVAGDRALAETNIVILVRQKIAGVLADMTSYARFLDRLERRGGRWAIVERAAIYERDRLDPVEPSEAFDKLFAATALSTYPEAYRYIGRSPQCGRARARAGCPLRRRPAHGAIVRALRRVAWRDIAFRSLHARVPQGLANFGILAAFWPADHTGMASLDRTRARGHVEWRSARAEPRSE
jgi:hypothetical protein